MIPFLALAAFVVMFVMFVVVPSKLMKKNRAVESVE